MKIELIYIYFSFIKVYILSIFNSPFREATKKDFFNGRANRREAALRKNNFFFQRPISSRGRGKALMARPFDFFSSSYFGFP